MAQAEVKVRQVTRVSMEAAAAVMVTMAAMVKLAVLVQLEYSGVRVVLSQVLMLTVQPVNIIVHSKHINI
jgi:hypothetical protein